MSDNQSGAIESREDYKPTARGQYEYWAEELLASKKAREKWHKQGNKIVKRFLDSRKDGGPQESAAIPFRLNLFHANVTTLQSMLYGNLPTVDVSRRFADPEDDVSRVAATMIDRLLNNDIAENGEELNSVLRAVLQDRLLPGLGCARVRYEVETETVEGEAEEPVEEVVSEDAPIDYFHWRDILWGWSRTWANIPWLAYRVWMTKDEVTERFGEETADELDYKVQQVSGENDSDDDAPSVWRKAEIWEIWDKTTREVVFFSKGFKQIIDSVEDPLGLNGFFPSPPFLIANPTTTLYEPTPDFQLAQDLYNHVDKLQTRIAVITEACKVVGVYNAESEGVSRMFKEGMENQLIPVPNWALFSEKGGLAGQIEWVPLADIVNALTKLQQLRDEAIDLLYQITGMSDVLRGGGAGQYEGVGQAQLKAKFGSVRVQALQEEFSTFASNLMRLKAEVISKHFSPETIAQRSNVLDTFDAELAPQAIELIKNHKLARLNIVIRPESVAMVDYAQLKQERTEYITALATFMQSAAPLIQQDPASKPFLLQLLQWGLAGFKGASEIEGVIDRAIEASQKQADEPQPPDPEQERQRLAMEMEQSRQQAKIAEIQLKAQADAQTREVDKQADIETALVQHRSKMQQIDAEMQAALAETRAKMEADLLIERAQTEANIMQSNQAASSEVQKNVAETSMEIEKEAAKTALKLDEIEAQSRAKIAQGNGVDYGQDK